MKIAQVIAILGLLGGCLYQQQGELHPLISFWQPSSFKPAAPLVIDHEGYTLAYDGRLRGASWVYEELTQASLKNTTDRSKFDFMEDPKIPSHLRSTKQDFAGSGYDRGHLRPAANGKASDSAMHDTFYLSNISPQHPQLNRHYWLKLEKHVRDLTTSFDTVYVITGPLFLSQKMDDGKRYVQYEVIGENEVAVPTHFFKVIHAKKGKTLQTEAYIIPNKPIKQETPLRSFSATLEKVEKVAGISFKK